MVFLHPLNICSATNKYCFRMITARDSHGRGGGHSGGHGGVVQFYFILLANFKIFDQP